MFDLEKLRTEGDRLTAAAGDLLGLKLTPEMAQGIFERSLGEERLKLYRVALLYANEADLCRSVDAYFSASLMVASAIEGLLALICLTAQKEVEPLGSYRQIKCKKKENYEKRILSAFLDDLIEIASDLSWIPSEIIDKALLDAALQDFPSVAARLYPTEAGVERSARASRFTRQPGIEMLRVLQDMRNLIHGTRWARMKIELDPAVFEADCKFTYVVANQVMWCLFETFNRKSTSGLADVQRLVGDIPPEYQELFRTLALQALGVTRG